MNALLEQLEQATASVHDRVAPSIVSIGRDHRGTGFVIGPDRVLTNAHNLRDRTVSVTFADGHAEQGTVGGLDADGDLVVLTVPTGDTPPLAWADGEPGIGRAVFALARGLRGSSIGFGLVSGTGRAFRGPRGRRIPGALEHTAPLARGSSGGPLVDAAGEVIGINTHRVGQGFYLARPADAELRSRVARLLGGETLRRPSLGVTLAPAEVARRLRRAVGLEEHDGLLVRGVDPGGPADRAGIREGDLLIGAHGATLSTIEDLLSALDAAAERGTLDVTLLRGADEISVTAPLSPPEGSTTDTGTA